MSYLLEALKKSDKERQRGTIPDLQADHSRPSVRRQRSRGASWNFPGVVVLVLLCGGGLFWWQYGRQEAPMDEALLERKELVVNEEAPVHVPSANVTSPRGAVTTETKSVPTEEKAMTPVGDVASVVPLLDELPVAIRAAIPDLSFAGHVYSDVPQKRLIIINNRIVREGDLVTNGLTLEKIDSEGVVLRYESSVFRVKLF